jgi:hypothetical protein
MAWLVMGAAWAQDPMWQDCRPRSLPMEAGKLFERPLPPLRPAEGLATPDQSVAGHRLVVDAAGWWLDGAVVTELPALDGVVLAIDRALPAPEVVRLFEALKASKAQVWTVSDAAGRFPVGSVLPTDLAPVPKNGQEPEADAPPGTVEAWSKVLSVCAAGKELAAPGDCSTIEAKWKAFTENPRCLLPPRMVRPIQGPMGAGSPTGVRVDPLLLDPGRPSWVRADQTWADVEGGAGWVVIGEPPWGEGLPRLDASELSVKTRSAPEWPEGEKKRGTEEVCDVRVSLGRDGRPTEAVATACVEPWAGAAVAAALRWEWQPPVVEGVVRPAETELKIRFLAGMAGVLEGE